MDPKILPLFNMLIVYNTETKKFGTDCEFNTEGFENVFNDPKSGLGESDKTVTTLVFNIIVHQLIKAANPDISRELSKYIQENIMDLLYEIQNDYNNSDKSNQKPSMEYDDIKTFDLDPETNDVSLNYKNGDEEGYLRFGLL